MRTYLLLLLLVAGCININCITGSGNVTEETREVGAFKSINLEGSGNLFVTQGSDAPIRIEAEDNILQVLKTTVSGDKLTIEHEQCINARKPINIYATMSDIEKLHISGSGTINTEKVIVDKLEVSISGSGDINSNSETAELKVKILGSGNAYLIGKSDDFQSTISGSGSIKSFDLDAKDVKIVHSGSGSHEVSASGTLDVKVSGSGNVRYKGDAEVNTDISGSGSVTKVP